MKKLEEILEKLSQSLNRDTLRKDKIIYTILNHTHVQLKPEDVNLSEGILEIRATPVVKNEIRLKEANILIDLKGLVSRILYK